MSQRYRHRYAAVLPRGLPGSNRIPPEEFPVASLAAAGAHRARPRSTRFEPVRTLKDVKRRFLAYSFPPRSPGPHHLVVLARPGFVRAAPALPGTTRIRLPSASPPCCDRTEAKVSHLHSKPQRLVAQPIKFEEPLMLGHRWNRLCHTTVYEDIATEPVYEVAFTINA